MKTNAFLTLALALFLTACASKQEEAPAEPKSNTTAPAAAPAAKELLPGESEEEIAEPADTPTNDALSNAELLIGKWFIPHSASIQITFGKDGRFVFNDYNYKTNQDEILKGSYTLHKGVLSLNYDDRPGQNFKFAQGENGDENYYITKGTDYYFVKGDEQ